MGASYTINGREALFLLSGKLMEPDPELIALVLRRLASEGYTALVLDMDGIDELGLEAQSALKLLKEQADQLGLAIGSVNAAEAVRITLIAQAIA